MPDPDPTDFAAEWWPNLPFAPPLETPATIISTHQPHTHDSGTMLPPLDPAPSAYPIPLTQVKDNNAGSSAELNIEPDESRRISRAEWERHHEVIKNHHPVTTLIQLRKIMASEHGFIASTQQWKKKLAEWHLSKNLPPRLTKFIKKRAHSRRIHGKKTTEFTHRGQPIPMDKIKRHLQEPQDDPQSPTGSTPDGISYRTYESPVLPFVGLTHPVDNSKSKEQEALKIGSLKMAFWQGRDVDSFLKIARTAISLSKKGDYLRAKPAFMESLEGLEALLEPYSMQTISILEAFVKAAVDAKDFGTAIERLHKSNNDHSCPSRALYKKQESIGVASSMLFNARQGLLAATSSDPEAAYNETKMITENIINILVEQGDYDAAETEALHRISEAEALGDAYLYEVAAFKHNLVHLWNDDEWQSHTIPRRRVEKFLLEVIQTNMTWTVKDRFSICAWEQLRVHYQQTMQIDKLQSLLPSIENFLSGLGAVNLDSLIKVWELKQGIARSFWDLRGYDKAEWWLLHIQAEVEQSHAHGPGCHRALTIHMMLGALYFDQGKREFSELAFKNAQRLARELLPLSHSFHAVVANAVAGGRIGSVCGECFINPPGRSSLPGTATEPEIDTIDLVDSDTEDLEEVSGEDESMSNALDDEFEDD